MSESLDQFIRDVVPPDSSEGTGASLPGHSVERLVARGGMGTVYQARQHGLNRHVAVKVMTERADRPQTAERFRREAWVLGQLEHPNIVPIHELGMDDQGLLFYTMKLVKGRTLQHILHALSVGDEETLRQHSLSSLLTIFRKVCDAMAFAHSQGVIHRDLKPENIMVGEFGEVLVMDWGLARIQDEKAGRSGEEETATDLVIPHLGVSSSLKTVQGAVMGTPQYMSPEQAQGRIDELDERSDIYSLGGILYAILTLRPPVEGTTLKEVLAKVRDGRITAPSDLQTSSFEKGQVLEARLFKPLPHAPGGRVPAALSAVVMKALRGDPALRYASVSALSADIEAYQAGFATTAENASAWKQVALFVKRHKAASIGAAAVLVIGGSLGTQALMEGRRAEQALRDLRLTAPVFQAQARFDFEEGRGDEAIRKIGYAIQLDERNPDYRVFRANLLQSSQQFAQAVADYRRALELRPGDASVRTNLELTERLLRESGGGSLTRQQEIDLLAALRQQGRLMESGPLAAKIDPDLATVKRVLDRRLHYFSKQPGWGAAKRVEYLPDGTFEVCLHRLAPGDLSVLKDQPISKLQLDEAGGTDISGLPRLPLKELSLYRSKVTDISPLRGLPLEVLSLSGLPVKDLSPLHGMKLRKLNINNLPVDDITVLKGMPLRQLDCNDCKSLFDLSPLRGAPLEILRTRACPFTDIVALGESPLKELLLDSCVVSDLSPLARCITLEMLDLRRTRVSDLSPLAGLRLKWINVGDSPVHDITPLRGQPLSFIRMQRSKVTDVAPLAECKLLEEIILPENARNVELLRRLPRLRRIATNGTPDYHPTQSAEEFWKAFDAVKK